MMSEEAILSVGKLSISVGTNSISENFLDLFPKNSKKKCHYYYAYDTVELKNAYSTKLNTVKIRLDLLGYTMKQSIKALKSVISLYNDYNDESVDFFEFYSYFSTLDIIHKKVDLDLLIYQDSRLISKINNNQLSEILSLIDLKYLIRIIANNSQNLNADVLWKCEDLIENGYITEDEIVYTNPINKILIATEGKTDAYILRESLKKLFPNISDIFYFFNYSINNHLNISGCKELAKFCKSISQLEHNSVLVLFDNDGDGNISYFNAKKESSKDMNLLILRLPYLTSMSKIIETDPWTQQDIEIDVNGKAIAIESFLDFKSINQSAEIDWEKGKYQQGKLKYKKKYQQAFKTAVKENRLTDGSYNTDKLKYLINFLINQWIQFVDNIKYEFSQKNTKKL